MLWQSSWCIQYLMGFIFFTGVNFIPTMVVVARVCFTPTAVGPGIPEIKAYLNGVDTPNMFGATTLIVKMLVLDLYLLQQREYFGQYGKVLKVSISRTSAGAIQHFDNTCSVYIPYSKEEETVQCIQSVYGFTLDGRSLRACFGTTKYCHAWLRNVSCSNPDCLYLHEIGTQEDSFTKDGIISAYTRNVCVCELNLIWRATNICADLLAENAAARCETFMLIHDAPKTLLTLLAKDRIGVGCLTRVHL
ncbi:CCR4-NOT transcription complex subunit 4 [Camellia lanceoleosa]|uniref:CCR4-NOT transcription complex subunit 4 n=1 Tax=Camellia lanceoleosa TaxID=1840588 RepID=A0ACC0HTU8_9ERIC|nr:CCR4-NOT transcription complex subunit 4 [Camellia lanceoleosa]